MAMNRSSRSESERHKVEREIVACMPMLKRFAISLCRNEAHAEDLVQQTMLKGFANLDKFELGTNLSAWLSTILRNEFLSDRRKMKREVEWNPEFEDAVFFSTGLKEDSAEAAYDFNRILLYLVCLPTDQSDALVAVGYLGMPYEEAAERLNCAVGTVKSRVNRARVGLLALIEETVLKQVTPNRLKTATKGVPKSHRYFPIAKAYEELYAACEGVSNKSNDKEHKGVHTNSHTELALKSERLWEELVASGALDEDNHGLTELMQGEWDDL